MSLWTHMYKLNQLTINHIKGPYFFVHNNTVAVNTFDYRQLSIIMQKGCVQKNTCL